MPQQYKAHPPSALPAPVKEGGWNLVLLARPWSVPNPEPRAWLTVQASATYLFMVARVAPPKIPDVCPQMGMRFYHWGSGEQGSGQPRSAVPSLQINDETELEALCAEIASQHLATESPEGPNKPCCRFTYLTMTGEEVELCSRGRHIPVA